MFPIPKKMYEKLRYKDLDKHRNFKDEIEKSKYIALMKTELKVIHTMNLDKVAMKLYYNKYDKPDSSLSNRCIDFKDMEKLAVQYSAENT